MDFSSQYIIVYSGLVEDANSLLAETREEHDEEHAKEIMDLYHPVQQHDSSEYTGQYPAGYHPESISYSARSWIESE